MAGCGSRLCLTLYRLNGHGQAVFEQCAISNFARRELEFGAYLCGHNKDSNPENAKAIQDTKKLEHRLQYYYQSLEWIAHLATIAGIALLATVAIRTF